ncbi:Hypothetical Protein MfeM64YM_0988 [Mycoplasmopsis fermentans M64]|uniref:Uncharacterized protein n=1 Tax=Mycoplasmopsis fermentans (strain M64) TaxID=943945 RepID=A0AB32XCY2_MYCFM|nr:Hypothetical Protein MfeM64YM_0988 [Mycoplasmopsis fermentans M64]
MKNEEEKIYQKLIKEYEILVALEK